MAPRIRQSVQQLQSLYDSGEDRSKLENVVRAFHGIQHLPPDDPNSFFMIGGYHGEPFRGPGATDPSWWGGYCHHGEILFPTWHRAYLYNLENALRSIQGCQDVTLPFWDETFDIGSGTPIPAVLTSPEFPLDGKNIKNPLYSYALQKAITESVEGADQRYSKPVGYQTVRYPLSGLVGTDADREATDLHNSSYADPTMNAKILNGNVSNWLKGKVQIAPDPPFNSPQPDTYSVYAKFLRCLDAPNYTVFSNTTSQNQWIKDHGGADKHFVVALESPHNAIHLAVGGFYQAGEYNADPILGANGDMGANEMAGFDPIFYLHHCFIDYVFWQWQKRHHATSHLDIKAGYPGTSTEEGIAPDFAPDTPLDMNTPLYPFKKGDGTMYNSADLVNIEEQLGYTYGPGSLDMPGQIRHGLVLVGDEGAAPIVATKRIHNINRSKIAGSFVVRLYAKNAKGEEVEVGREAILSRWSVARCANCQDKLNVEVLVPIDETTLGVLRGARSAGEVEFYAKIQSAHIGRTPINAPKGPGEGPQVGDL